MTRRVGSAHRNRLMQANVPRKFTLLDAMVLIAATAVAFVLLRVLFARPGASLLDSFGYPIFGPLSQFASDLHMIVSPFVVTWSAALCILRMRRPRPRLSRVFRQPGISACSAILIASACFLIRCGVLSCYYFVRHGLSWADASGQLRQEGFWREFAGSVD